MSVLTLCYVNNLLPDSLNPSLWGSDPRALLLPPIEGLGGKESLNLATTRTWALLPQLQSFTGRQTGSGSGSPSPHPSLGLIEGALPLSGAHSPSCETGTGLNVSAGSLPAMKLHFSQFHSCSISHLVSVPCQPQGRGSSRGLQL